MSTFSRRSFIAGLSTIPFAIWFEKYASAQTVTRFNVTSGQGQMMLGIYRQAVGTMMSTPEASPVGWLFEWYTHAVRRDRTKAGEIARIYPNPSPEKTLAQEVWNTCQPHHAGSVEDYFLPWHRMYVFFFERIIRKISGNPGFTLPYWNYSSTTSQFGPRLPARFRNPSNSQNPLFRPDRNGLANNGQPIDQNSPGALNLSVLQECTYSPQGSQSGFNMNLDMNLHGNVHVLVGNQVGMGRVPWAANDPIFWMHHCNIDRLWASWNRAGRQNPTSNTWLTKQFVFADENGNRVVGTVQDFNRIAPLRYTYDRFEPVPACSSLGLSASGPQRRALVPTGAVVLGDQPVRVRLESTGASAGVGDDIVRAVRRLNPNRRLFLVLRNLQTEMQPGVLYNIYLELPASASATGANSYHVGVINFFGAETHGEEHAAAASADKFFSFDITRLAKDLVRRRRLTSSPTLTIAPAGRPESEARPVIGEISVEEQ